jgi:hypothetical protein
MTSKPHEQPPFEARALEVIRAHPWASLLGAVALGFLVARIVRSER